MSGISNEHWADAQAEEAAWWGDCCNTLGEELKQLVYARHMGLIMHQVDGIPYQIDGTGKSFIDLGGGPSSLLLKVTGSERSVVSDPCKYPPWVRTRYKHHGVNLYEIPAEDYGRFSDTEFDEVWLYNCLQHTINPEAIVRNALRLRSDGGLFRIFEWVDTEVNDAHPHSLTAEQLDEWCGTPGATGYVDENGATGFYYANVVVKWPN
mgnify:CR=1 FL=1